MVDDDSLGSLSKTLIGGSTGVKEELGAEVSTVADTLDVEMSDSSEIFKDISETLEPSNSYLSNIVTSGRKLYVPGFQRKFSWDETNHNEFWYSLTKLYSRIDNTDLSDGKISLWSAGSDDRLEEFYFGTIYLSEARKDNGDDIYEVIDGQQRLTTVFIILNEIRKLLEGYEDELRESEEYTSDDADGIETLRMGIIGQFLYTNMAYSGSGDHVRLRLTDHDHPFFQMLLEDKEKNILKIANELENGTPPHWRKIENILNKLDVKIDEEEFDVKDIADEDEYESLDEILAESKQFTDSQEHLVNARSTYNKYIINHLDNELQIPEEAYKARSLALINLSIILITSFRIIECKFREPVDETLKVDVFQSLNETGKSLDIHEKIMARVVAVFGIDSDEVGDFERLVEDFGGKENKIKNYLTNYIIAIEDGDIYDKGEVENNLLQIFNTQDSVKKKSLTSRLTKGSNRSEFIQNLCSHTDKYRAVDGKRDLDVSFFDTATVRTECQNILDDLQGDQWKPFVLLLYIELSKDNIDESFFKQMLELVEKFMLRNTFASGAATTIDRTFIAACVKYNNETKPEFDEIPAYENQDWTDEIDNFNTRTRDIMEAHMVKNSSWNDLSGGQLIRNLYNPTWSNIKPILKKLARVNTYSNIERGRSGAVEGHKTINFSDLEREHILPQTPKLQNKDSPYAWFRDFYQIDEDNPPREEVRSVYNSLVTDDEHTDENYDRLKRLSDTFIDDIGNSILLQNKLNKAIQNRQFSVKILSYYLRSYSDLDDFGEYIGNLENLEIEITDLVNLIECFGNSLNDRETELLLYEAEQIFSTIGIGDVNEMCSAVTLNSTSPVDESELTDRYDSPVEFFEDFNIEEDSHEKLHDEWKDYTMDELAEQDGSNEPTLGMMLDQTIESILAKIADKNDETGDNHEEVCGNETEYDSIVSRINKIWTWEDVIDRKISLIMEIKELVKLDTIEDEFREYEDERSHHRERVEEAIKY